MSEKSHLSFTKEEFNHAGGCDTNHNYTYYNNGLDQLKINDQIATYSKDPKARELIYIHKMLIDYDGFNNIELSYGGCHSWWMSFKHPNLKSEQYDQFLDLALKFHKYQTPKIKQAIKSMKPDFQKIEQDIEYGDEEWEGFGITIQKNTNGKYTIEIFLWERS